MGNSVSHCDPSRNVLSPVRRDCTIAERDQNEALASLRNTVISCVDETEICLVARALKPPTECLKAVVARESGNVLQNHSLWTQRSDESQDIDNEIVACVVERAQGLALGPKGLSRINLIYSTDEIMTLA